MSRSEIEVLREENAQLRARIGLLVGLAAAHPLEGQLRDLLDAMPEVAAVVTPRGEVLEANHAFGRSLGRAREELVGANLRDVLDAESFERRQEWAREVVAARETRNFIDQRNGHTFETVVHPVTNREGVVDRLAFFARDVTPRHRAESQFRILLENVHLVAVILDPSGRVVLANPHLAHLTGHAVEDIEGQDWFERFIPEEIRPSIRQVFQRTLVLGDVPQHHENEIMTAIGEHRMIRWSNSVLRDERGEITGVASLGEDVTERRREQAALLHSGERLRALATQLSLVEDRERRRFATALHDEISQELVVLRLKITSMLADAPSHMRSALDDLQSLLGSCLERTRLLTYDLSPPVLYELGLEPAIESIGARMAAEHGLEFEFEVRGATEPLIDEIGPVLFRVVRELLVNVIKHAQASMVRVAIRRDFPFVALVVEDDGNGFAPGWNKQEASGGGFGLFSIRERMRQLGGTLEIGRSQLGGAVVIVTCPLATPEAEGPRVDPVESG